MLNEVWIFITLCSLLLIVMGVLVYKIAKDLQ